MAEFGDDFDLTGVPLEHVLRCSLEKIHDARRCRTGANLRKNLMIANVIFKSRNEILKHRTRVFMERNRQLPGIKGRLPAYSTPSMATPDEYTMTAEPRNEEVLEECLVQEDFLLEPDEEPQELAMEDAPVGEDEEVDVCIEKENSPPPALFTPLTLELPEESPPSGGCEPKSPRKRRSADENALQAQGATTPWPNKRATPESSPEPAPIHSAVCSLTENFQKAISFQLPCGRSVADGSTGSPSGQVAVLLPLNPLVAAS